MQDGGGESEREREREIKKNHLDLMVWTFVRPPNIIMHAVG